MKKIFLRGFLQVCILGITGLAQPVLSVLPDTLDFGSSEDTLSITISNSGSDTLLELACQ
jgi:hypothetical protein